MDVRREALILDPRAETAAIIFHHAAIMLKRYGAHQETHERCADVVFKLEWRVAPRAGSVLPAIHAEDELRNKKGC